MITLEEIQATGLSNYGDIADALSAGRTKIVPTEIGNGMILATLGLEAGNALLDAIYTVNDFRYVRPLLEQGRLDISSDLARAALDGLVGVVAGFTQGHADLIKNLAVRPDPVTPVDVQRVMEGAV